MLPCKQSVLLIKVPVTAAFTSHAKQDISLNMDFLKLFVRDNSITFSIQSLFVENM